MFHEKPSILIVDDTPANLALLSEVLQDDYRIRVAVDGEKALSIARSQDRPEVILLDVMMPGMDGYEVCRQLKAGESTRGITVIFVTAMGETEDEMRGLELGGVDYLTKPISPPIVKARLKTHVALCRQARELEALVERLGAQSRELQSLNRSLEDRVAEEVGKVELLGRLKRFFSPPVVDLMLSGSVDDPLKSHRREIVAVFLDLRGFTAFSETADPEEVMTVIAEYHETMGRLIMEFSGTLEHFAGDGMMIFFNDPVEIDHPACVALSMALRMQDRFAVCNRGWAKRGYQLAMGVGVAQGYATIGAIGFEGRRDYGVIGNVTNLAARLCSEAVGGQILISQRVFAATSELVATEPVGELTLKGFHKPVSAYAVTGLLQDARALSA